MLSGAKHLLYGRHIEEDPSFLRMTKGCLPGTQNFGFKYVYLYIYNGPVFL